MNPFIQQTHVVSAESQKSTQPQRRMCGRWKQTLSPLSSSQTNVWWKGENLPPHLDSGPCDYTSGIWCKWQKWLTHRIRFWVQALRNSQLLPPVSWDAHSWSPAAMLWWCPSYPVERPNQWDAVPGTFSLAKWALQLMLCKTEESSQWLFQITDSDIFLKKSDFCVKPEYLSTLFQEPGAKHIRRCVTM